MLCVKDPDAANGVRSAWRGARAAHFLGSKPSARIATFSSFASIVPEPSVSKRSNASRISCFCSSVSSNCHGGDVRRGGGNGAAGGGADEQR